MGDRRQHVLVDTLGNILALKVTPADIQDRDGALLLFALLQTAFGWLKLIRADGGYIGKPVVEAAGIKRHRKIKLEIVKRSDDVKGFKVLPKRWIVHDLSLDEQTDARQDLSLTNFQTAS